MQLKRDPLSHDAVKVVEALTADLLLFAKSKGVSFAALSDYFDKDIGGWVKTQYVSLAARS